MAVARAAAACLAALVLPSAAAPEEFEVDPGHTFPAFAVSHLGISTQRGRFERTTGSIVLDREAGRGSLEIAIDATALSTGNARLDAVLKDEDFFDVARFPVVTYSARSIEFEGAVPKRVAGELTLRDVTLPVVLEVVRFGCTRLPFFVRLTCGADLVAGIRRSDFGLTAFQGWVGDDVRLEIQVEAVKKEPAAEQPAVGG